MENSIAKMRPELVPEWSEKNLPLTPAEVPFGSNKRYWWRGQCGHEWQTSAKARSQGEKCPICSNTRIIPGINDLESLHPKLAEEWSPKNTLPASALGEGSHKKAIWKGRCGHEWTAVIRSRVGGAGCPYCSHNLVLAGFNDLETLVPAVAQEWSPRNFPLRPSQVTPYANRKVWWRCQHGHEWETLISTRSYGSQCPYCSGIKLLRGFNDLATLHPDLAEEWSIRNGELTPDGVNGKSPRNVWWRCKTCGNEYKAVIKSRVHGLQCPVCTERAVLKGYNDLETTDAELMKEWDYEMNIKRAPSTFSRYSMYPVWWKGACGHRWKDKIFHRTVEGTGCIYCEGEFRRALPQLLVLYYAKHNSVKAYVDDDRMIGVPLDVMIPAMKIAFVFPYKGTNREQGVLRVLRHLCETRGLIYEEIYQKDPLEICVAIKQAFAKARIYINSDSEKDIAAVRERYLSWRTLPK